MQTLLTVIVTWLSVNFGLPSIHQHPGVEFASKEKMLEVRYSRLAPERAGRHAVDTATGHEVEAVYDDASRTLYLRKGWTGATPVDVSVLVHEMVHHLQNVGGLRYPCPAAREAPAYRAQALWLELFDKSLADEFGLDAMTILVRTRCMR